jgi:tetratricopeptide (TPR) repeat protein
LFSLTASIFPFRYVVTDYRQYLPSIFLCLVISLVCFSFKRRALSVILLSGMTLYFSVSSYKINQNWKTEESFWQQSVKYGAIALAHQNYGLTIVGNNPELAEYHYLEAIRQNPFHIYANINLGMLHIRMGKEEEGLLRLRRMVALNPDWAMAHYWLSEGLKLTGQKEEALKEMQLAADLDARSLKYQYAAARALQSAGRRLEAIPYFERIIDLDPNYKLTEFWLGFAYQKSAQSQKAIDTYVRFLKHNPDHVQSHFNLAYGLMSENDCQTAIVHFDKVLELMPSYREAHLYLSRCHRTLGNEFLAEKHEIISKKRN